MKKPEPNAWQTSLRDEVLELLEGLGVTDIKVTTKVTRFDEDEPRGGPAGEAAAAAATGAGPLGETELSIVLRFGIEGDAFEVWVYEDEVGVLEPGDEWWLFDADEFASKQAIAAGVGAHLRSLFE